MDYGLARNAPAFLSAEILPGIRIGACRFILCPHSAPCGGIPASWQTKPRAFDGRDSLLSLLPQHVPHLLRLVAPPPPPEAFLVCLPMPHPLLPPPPPPGPSQHSLTHSGPQPT